MFSKQNGKKSLSFRMKDLNILCNIDYDKKKSTIWRWCACLFLIIEFIMNKFIYFYIFLLIIFSFFLEKNYKFSIADIYFSCKKTDTDCIKYSISSKLEKQYINQI